MRDGSGIPYGLLCNDIYGSRNGRGSEKSRTSSAHNLYPIHHICRKLFYAVNTGERTEDRTGIYEDLGVLSVKSIDPDLLEAAVLTIVLDPYSRLERESLSHSRAVCSVPDPLPERSLPRMSVLSVW